MKLISIAILATCAALAMPAASASSAVRCGAGEGLEYIEMRETEGGYQPWLRSFRGPGRAMGQPVVGSMFNEHSNVFSDQGRYPITASFYTEDEGPSFAVWFSANRKIEQSGTLMHRAISSRGPRKLVLTYIDQGVSSDSVGVDLVYDLTGQKIAERRREWVDEDYSRLEISVTGDVLYRRYGPGMAADRLVELYSSQTFDRVAAVSVGDLVIDDVLVLDRNRVFLAAGGALFHVHDGQLRSLNDENVKMRFERLDYHSGTQRILAFGPGGYRVYKQDGELLAIVEDGLPISTVAGFADDGHVFENGVEGRFDLRVRDVMTGAPLAQLAIGQGPQRVGHQLACISADGIVVRDRNRMPVARHLMRAPGRP